MIAKTLGLVGIIKSATLGFIAVLFMASGGTANETGIVLDCSAVAYHRDLICAAIRAAIEETYPAAVVHDDLSGFTQGDPLTIRPVVLEMNSRVIEARLDWGLPEAPLRSGPVTAFAVRDATLSPQIYNQFAQGLVRNTPLPIVN